MYSNKLEGIGAGAVQHIPRLSVIVDDYIFRTTVPDTDERILRNYNPIDRHIRSLIRRFDVDIETHNQTSGLVPTSSRLQRSLPHQRHHREWQDLFLYCLF